MRLAQECDVCVPIRLLLAGACGLYVEACDLRVTVRLLIVALGAV